MAGIDLIPIGVDFDNTIVCYDRVFYKAALELHLIPADIPVTKESVRDYLRKTNREDEWTKLQGFVYGMRMNDAELFPGLMDFFQSAKKSGYKICIISHKTKKPYAGPPYDLHTSALNWMESRGFFNPEVGAIKPENVFLEPTRVDKLKRIETTECRIFIDDLPEFLSEPTFPKNVQRVLFSPGATHLTDDRWHCVQGWSEFSAFAHDYLSSHGS